MILKTHAQIIWILKPTKKKNYRDLNGEAFRRKIICQWGEKSLKIISQSGRYHDISFLKSTQFSNKDLFFPLQT